MIGVNISCGKDGINPPLPISELTDYFTHFIGVSLVLAHC